MRRPKTRRDIDDDALRKAHGDLTRALLLDVSAEAFAAESGTGQYGYENILGVGIGQKEVRGEVTPERCLAVYVMAKAGKKEIARRAFVPKLYRGIPTDVVPVGEITAYPFRGRYRPAPGGVSIGHPKVTAGTLGCLVKRDGDVYILSNNHVLANANAARIGDPIVQPGTYDGGIPSRDTIATLAHFVRLRFGGSVENMVDAALAKPTDRDLVRAHNIGYGAIGTTIAPARLNLAVKKSGRTTQKTTGKVTGLGATMRVSYGSAGMALFTGQIVIRSTVSSPFSQGGDSGSLILTQKGNNPVALLFAGSASHTIASPIGEVLKALRVDAIVS